MLVRRLVVRQSGSSHILYDWQYLASKKNISGGIYISYGDCSVYKGRGGTDKVFILIVGNGDQ